MSVESWANNSSLREEYERQYSVLSANTHYCINSLENKGEDKLTYLSFSFAKFDENVIIASYEMMKCILRFLQFINCEKYKNEMTDIDNQFKIVVKQLKNTK